MLQYYVINLYSSVVFLGFMAFIFMRTSSAFVVAVILCRYRLMVKLLDFSLSLVYNYLAFL